MCSVVDRAKKERLARGIHKDGKKGTRALPIRNPSRNRLVRRGMFVGNPC